jgi:hypothetical protein
MILRNLTLSTVPLLLTLLLSGCGEDTSTTSNLNQETKISTQETLLSPERELLNSFPQGLSVFNASGSINIGGCQSEIHQNGDITLGVASNKLTQANCLNQCEGTECKGDADYAQKIDLPDFLYNTLSNGWQTIQNPTDTIVASANNIVVQTNGNFDASIDNTLINDIASLTIQNNSDFHFNYNGNKPYIIKSLSLNSGNNHTITFEPGSYFIENFNHQAGTNIAVAGEGDGSGVVRLYIKNNITINSHTNVNFNNTNISGYEQNAASLFLVSYNGEIKVESDVNIAAFGYVQNGDITVHASPTSFSGTLVANNIIFQNGVKFWSTNAGGETTETPVEDNDDTVETPVEDNNNNDTVETPTEDNNSSDDDTTETPVEDNNSSDDNTVETPVEDNNSSNDDTTETPVEDDATDENTTDSNADIAYGARTLKLLTRVEYQNTMEDLVGIDFEVSDALPFDSLIEGYSNNAFSTVTESHEDTYLTVAEKVSQWSAEHNFEGVVECGFDKNGNSNISYEECESRFLNNFATRVFRRPLNATEHSIYEKLFDDSLTGGDIKEALKLSMTALLSAPQFIYRSELGTPVKDLLKGSASTVDAADFETKSTGGAADGNSWNIWSDGYIQNSFDLANDEVFKITMKGDQAQNIWPNMELAIDGTVVATKSIDSSNYKEYEFNIKGHAGTHEVQIRFTNDVFENNEDRNLYVQSVSVSGASSTSSAINSIDLSLLDDDAYVLSDYEMASFLSYTMTGTTPDETLLNAAKDGKLTTQAQIQQQVKRLLNTDAAKEHLGVFVSQWLASDEILNSQKDMTLFPDFTDEIRVAMAAEVKAFFNYVFYSEDQGFSDLFSADYVLVNKPLAKYYGLGNVDTQSNDPQDFVKVDARSAHRGGLLTMGAFLANEADLTKSSPIKRAAGTRMRILCQDIPQPDDTIPDLRIEKMEKLLAELDGKVITTREYFKEITKDTPCSFCHDEIINPLGFAYEDYDASGRYITSDHNGLPIDSTGKLIGINSIGDGDMIDLLGGKDISNKFAELEAVKSCFSANVFRFAMDTGHDTINKMNSNAGDLTDEEKEDYANAVNIMSETLSTSNSMAEMFTKLGTLDLVRFRKQMNR